MTPHSSPYTASWCASDTESSWHTDSSASASLRLVPGRGACGTPAHRRRITAGRAPSSPPNATPRAPQRKVRHCDRNGALRSGNHLVAHLFPHGPHEVSTRVACQVGYQVTSQVNPEGETRPATQVLSRLLSCMTAKCVTRLSQSVVPNACQSGFLGVWRLPTRSPLLRGGARRLTNRSRRVGTHVATHPAIHQSGHVLSAPLESARNGITPCGLPKGAIRLTSNARKGPQADICLGVLHNFARN